MAVPGSFLGAVESSLAGFPVRGAGGPEGSPDAVRVCRQPRRL